MNNSITLSNKKKSIRLPSPSVSSFDVLLWYEPKNTHMVQDIWR